MKAPETGPTTGEALAERARRNGERVARDQLFGPSYAVDPEFIRRQIDEIRGQVVGVAAVGRVPSAQDRSRRAAQLLGAIGADAEGAALSMGMALDLGLLGNLDDDGVIEAICRVLRVARDAERRRALSQADTGSGRRG